MRLHAFFCALAIVSGCANGSSDPLELPDAATPDTSTPMDAATEDAAPVDAGLVWDGAVPEAAAVLFAEVDLGGASRLVTSDLTTLGNLTNDAASLVVAEGYTLYGATLDDYGGDLSDPYVGPITVNDLGVLADQWESVIFRPSTEPVATVYRTVGGTPKVYPIGVFPSLGATNDIIDGLSLPAGITFVGYDDGDLAGTERGPYVGPLDVGALPYRDVWSSLRVRATTPLDEAVGDIRLYQNSNYGGALLVLTAGRYPSLATFPGLPNLNNDLSSMRGRAALAVFGFEYGDFGGNVFGPLVGDIAQLMPNDDWDSVIVYRTSDPTVTIYFDGGFTTPAQYPIVNVSDLQGRSNQVDGVLVPAGYVVHAFSHDRYGGTTGTAWTHGEGMFATVHDDWDSFIVRPVTEPTVTLYFNAASGDPRVYPLGSYLDLQTAGDAIDGANVPCGVRITAYQNANRGGTVYTVTGPTNIASVPGANVWSSMDIERVAASCP
jgi:hypothetical protein